MPEGKAFARLLKRYYWRVTKRKEQHGLSSYSPVRPVAVDLCTAPQDTEGSCTVYSGWAYLARLQPRLCATHLCHVMRLYYVIMTSASGG